MGFRTLARRTVARGHLLARTFARKDTYSLGHLLAENVSKENINTKIFFINNNSKRTRLRVSILGSVPGNPEPRWVSRSQKLGILAGSSFVGTRKPEIYYGFSFLETRFSNDLGVRRGAGSPFPRTRNAGGFSVPGSPEPDWVPRSREPGNP